MEQRGLSGEERRPAGSETQLRGNDGAQGREERAGAMETGDDGMRGEDDVDDDVSDDVVWYFSMRDNWTRFVREEEEEFGVACS